MPRKAVIALNGLDLYDVEIGRTDRAELTWHTERIERNVDAAQLGETLLRLHGEVS